MKAGRHFQGWVRVGDVFVCVPAKNGSTAFRKAIAPHIEGAAEFREWAHSKGLGPYTPEDVEQMEGTKYLSVRDPVERFASLWRHQTRDIGKRGFANLSPDELMDRVAACPLFNKHVYPQYLYMVTGAIPVRSDDLLSTLGLEPRRENVTKSYGEPMPVERIRRHYAQDVALWERVKESDSGAESSRRETGG